MVQVVLTLGEVMRVWSRDRCNACVRHGVVVEQI